MTLQPVNVDELAREKVKEIEDLLNSSTEGIKLDLVNSWMSILKKIITAADLHRTNDKNDNYELNTKTKKETEESIYADFSDDNEQFNAIDLTEQFASNSVKRTIRVQAFKIVHRLVHIFSKNFTAQSKAILLRHLPDLVRLSFVAATSPFDDLKLQGFEMFKFLINRFAAVEEREFPGHSILEQYRTQVISALKPAFNLDSPPYITAIASQVCSLWISRGLEKDDANLERTYQLMILTITKLEQQSMNQNSALYTESELEQERLDILASWAQLYIISLESCEVHHKNSTTKSTDTTSFDRITLRKLIKKDIGSLIGKWWDALKDYALLIMPSYRMISMSHDNEHVYTREVALRLFEPTWFKLVLASTFWLCFDYPSDDLKTSHDASKDKLPNSLEKNDSKADSDSIESLSVNRTATKSKYFKFICGILMKEFCRVQVDGIIEKENIPESTLFSNRSLSLLLRNTELKSIFIDELAIPLEFYTIIYSILNKLSGAKSQHRLALKNTLELLFQLVLSKVKEKSDHINYGLAFLVEFIPKCIAIIVDTNNTSELEKSQARLDISINLFTLLTLLTLKPDLNNKDPILHGSIVSTFSRILSADLDTSLIISLLDHIRSSDTEQNQTFCILLDQLFDVQVSVFSKLLDANYSSDNLEFQTSQRLNAYRRLILSTISLTNEKNRQNFIKCYHDSLFFALNKLSNHEKISPSNSKDKYIILQWINEMSKNYPVEAKEALTDEQKQILEEAEDSKNEVKQGAQNSRKSTSSSSTKPQMKITLKADFSNFYAKKS